MRAMEAKDGDSALHWAVFRGEERIVRLLLEAPPPSTARHAPAAALTAVCCRLVPM